MESKISIINFYEEKIKYLFSSNEKYHKWPEQEQYLRFFETVPEHSAALNFILKNLVKDGVEGLDFWTLQKLTLDYLIYGGFTVEVIPLRGGGRQLQYLDLGKCRLSPDKKQMGYSEDWKKNKVEVQWKDIVPNMEKPGIFYFKNNMSRQDYPTPQYMAATLSLETMSNISLYHNENAKNGFTPSVVINFNNGDPGPELKKEIEKKLQEKFTGPGGNKIITSFNDGTEKAVTIEKLENDNLDQKFETLQKFIQNQILISHQITSPQLIGVRPENQGFSKTEYEESMAVFQETVINTYRREMEYALGKLMNKEVKLEATV